VAKLCLEWSPQDEATVVSVVTRGLSDDCTSESVEGNSLWLRATRLGPDYVFHVSADGARWRFVRHFGLHGVETPLIGLQAQSPTGPGCATTFEDLSFGTDPPADLRDGS
jgi:regulation of enolase protein 1 (concanavalin A-like superfamily)